jgi:DNA-binding transcriptional ArsR family regulator
VPVEFDNYRDRRTAGEALPVDPESNAFQILQFLARRPKLGFKPSEIGEAVEIPEGSVSPTLARLEQRGLVEHESPYWSAGDDDRLASLDGTIHTMRAFEERHDDDEFDGWHETDVDPREHR